MKSETPPPSPPANPVFLNRAKECIRFSHVATNDAEKESWLLIAEQWLRMALPQRSLKQKEFEEELDAKHTGQQNSDSMN